MKIKSILLGALTTLVFTSCGNPLEVSRAEDGSGSKPNVNIMNSSLTSLCSVIADPNNSSYVGLKIAASSNTGKITISPSANASGHVIGAKLYKGTVGIWTYATDWSDCNSTAFDITDRTSDWLVIPFYASGSCPSTIPFSSQFGSGTVHSLPVNSNQAVITFDSRTFGITITMVEDNNG